MPLDNSGQWFPPSTVNPSDLHAPFPPGYPYNNLVPPYNNETPGEILIRYYGDRRNDRRESSAYWDLWELALSRQGNIGAPAAPQRSVAKTKPVPLYGMGRELRSHTVIEFKNSDQAGVSTGVQLEHFIGSAADPNRLRGARDIISELRGLTPKFVIGWPGYQSSQFTIHTVDANGRPLTRVGLAAQIAIAYATFFGKVQQEQIVTFDAGPYSIALHRGHVLGPGSQGVQLSQLHLLKFRKSSSGSWVADIEIV